jgi:hypothetical protein
LKLSSTRTIVIGLDVVLVSGYTVDGFVYGISLELAKGLDFVLTPLERPNEISLQVFWVNG